jgi:hypothetical protein
MPAWGKGGILTHALLETKRKALEVQTLEVQGVGGQGKLVGQTKKSRSEEPKGHMGNVALAM